MVSRLGGLRSNAKRRLEGFPNLKRAREIRWAKYRERKAAELAQAEAMVDATTHERPADDDRKVDALAPLEIVRLDYVPSLQNNQSILIKQSRMINQCGLYNISLPVEVERVPRHDPPSLRRD